MGVGGGGANHNFVGAGFGDEGVLVLVIMRERFYRGLTVPFAGVNCKQNRLTY